MTGTRLRRALAFGLSYVIVSIVVEGALIVVFRLSVPRDNRILAPAVLTLPPVLTALWCGYRAALGVAVAALAAAAFTVLFTLVAFRLTGIRTGLAEPLAVRAPAGVAAGWIAAGWAAPVGTRKGGEHEGG